MKEARIEGKSTHLDDTNGDCLPHVTDGETTKGRELLEGLDTHGLGGHQDDDGGITRLDGLGVLLGGFACNTKIIELEKQINKTEENVRADQSK